MFCFFNLKKQQGLHIDKAIPINEARYVVLDTELTGLDERKDSIVSIGAVRMLGGRIDLSDSFYRLVNPEADFTPESVVIHGITPSDVEEKPAIETVLKEFLRFCGDDIVVGHCVSIDLSFITREMKKVFGFPLQNTILDTVLLYEFARTRSHSHASFASPPRDYKNLYDIAKSLGIPVSGAHNAMMDAFITAQVLQRLIPMLMSAGIRNIGNLLKLSLRGGGTFRASREMVAL